MERYTEEMTPMSHSERRQLELRKKMANGSSGWNTMRSKFGRKSRRKRRTEELPVQKHGRLEVQPPSATIRDRSMRGTIRNNLSSHSSVLGGATPQPKQKSLLQHFSEQDSDSDDSGGDSASAPANQAPQPQNMKQYRLSINKSNYSLGSTVLHAMGISTGESGIYDNVGSSRSSFGCCGFQPDALVTGYLFWTFRVSFMLYMLSAVINFAAITVFFAVLIYASGRNKPECVHVNGEAFGHEPEWGADFLDAYSLSWTTFSTVGYGLVYPSTSTIQNGCFAIQALTTLESFVGILFASFTGAILFSKITRISSLAQVDFSDPIVVRYGTGVSEGDGESSDEDEERFKNVSKRNLGGAGGAGRGAGTMKNRFRYQRNSTLDMKYKVKIPCPILEFRVVNTLHSALKGEIMDCQMMVQASIDAKNADPLIRNSGNRLRRKKGRKRPHRKQPPVRHSMAAISMANSSATNSDSLNAVPELKPMVGTVPKEKEGRSFGTPKKFHADASSTNTSSLHSVETADTFHGDSIRDGGHFQKRTHTLFDEDPTGYLVPKRIFSRLEIESPDHPFFKRVWIARHVVNEHSPLLTVEARRLVRENGGTWPQHLNNYEKVRESIQFDQILVSLSGTSNNDANSVYAQKVYEYADMNVGYRFCNMLYRDLRGGNLSVDETLLNDVVEQRGGGGEPFQHFDRETSEIVVL